MRTGTTLLAALHALELTEDERQAVVEQLADWNRTRGLHPSVAELPLKQRRAIADQLGAGRDLLAMPDDERRRLTLALEAIRDPRELLGAA